MSQDPFHFCPLPEEQAYRNARIKFPVRFVDNKSAGNTGAICFRYVDYSHCYGAGLGGWECKFSFFERGDYGFRRQSFGADDAIQIGSEHVFEIAYRANRLLHFNHVLPSGKTMPLIHDLLLHRAYLTPDIGLYAFQETPAHIEILENEDLKIRCFLLCRIDPHTNFTIRDIQRVLQDNGVDPILRTSEDLVTYPGLMQTISNEILESDFVIADFRGGLRPNVAYETGISHALNLPTIHLIDNLADRPSDLGSQYFIMENQLPQKLPRDVKMILSQKVSNVRYLWS